MFTLHKRTESPVRSSYEKRSTLYPFIGIGVRLLPSPLLGKRIPSARGIKNNPAGASFVIKQEVAVGRALALIAQ